MRLSERQRRITGGRHIACGSRLANWGDCHGAAALDGKPGRDQQQSNGREVTDVNAVRRSERDQNLPFWEWFNDYEPDGNGGQHERLEPAAALDRSRHLEMISALV
jgi:hypothetical protein